MIRCVLVIPDLVSDHMAGIFSTVNAIGFRVISFVLTNKTKSVR